MGRRRKGRPVHGILLLDKAGGLSSNQALQRIKRLYGAAKAGHTGSLDPLATGVLPLCFGEATKLSGHLLNADKWYRVTMQWGIQTDTGDADGSIIERSAVPDWDDAGVDALLDRFRGDIVQTPPMYSAVKHEGRRLYELARAGQEVERKTRQVRIHRLMLVEREESTWTLDVHCSKGTYIRSLVEDLASAAQSVAHVSALRRTQVGPFDQKMYREEELQALAESGGQLALDALLLPLQSALKGWPEVHLDADSRFYFRRGQAVQVRGPVPEGQFAVIGPDEELLGLAEMDQDGRVAPRRVLELKGADL